MSLWTLKKQVEDNLKCAVCLDEYTNPKMLPCAHTFCLLCIQELQQEGQRYIKCPLCQVDHPLPEGGVANLTTAFHISGFQDLQDNPILSENKQSLFITVCAKHEDIPLELYCETCHKGICQDCSISEEHNTHNFHLISECYFEHHRQLEDNLNIIKQKIIDIDKANTRLAAREREVVEQGKQLKRRINTHAQQIIDQTKESCTRLSQQVDNIVQQKTEVLTTQKEHVEKLHTQLKTCQDVIEHYLKKWTELQILLEKQRLMDEMDRVTQNVDPAVIQPIENAIIEFQETKTNNKSKEIGIVSSTIYGKATLMALPTCYIAKQQSTVRLTLQSRDGSQLSLPSSLVSSTLTSSDKTSVKCNIAQACAYSRTCTNKYNITFTPPTRGEHILTVQVGGVDIPDSPFTFHAMPTPGMRGKPVKMITGLNTPVGVAVFGNGDIVVSEYGTDCIQILNKHGRKLRSFSQFKRPRGVAIAHDGHILVTNNHQLQKLTGEEVCVKSVGSSKKGKGSLEFNGPGAITVHPSTGQIFVADCDNNRIQVFTRDLTFSHTIAHKQLKQPGDVALDKDGYLYTTDVHNRCITKFSTYGKYIQCFTSFEGSWFSKLLSGPHFAFLAIQNNLVYISEYKHDRVLIFDNSGQLLHSFGKTGKGEGELDKPSGISTDTLGNLYVCDTNNDRVVVY